MGILRNCTNIEKIVLTIDNISTIIITVVVYNNHTRMKAAKIGRVAYTNNTKIKGEKMKKLLLLMVLVMVTSVFTGCNNSSETTVDSKAGDANKTVISKGDKVGVSLTSRSSERWLRDGKQLEKDLTDAGYKVDLQYAEGVPQNQIQIIENMITAGCKAIIVAPVDNGSLSSVFATAKEQGVVVINYDLGHVGTSDIDYFVGFDNSKVGVMQANTIIKELELDKGAEGPFNIELIAGSLDEANCYYYFEGAMETLQPYIDEGKLVVKSGQTTIEQVTVIGWKHELLVSRLDNIITTFYSDGSRVDAILCPADGLANVTSTCLQEKGYGENDLPLPVITGNDATLAVLKLIAKEKVTMSVFKDSSLLSKACVDILDALAKGEEPEVNATYTPDVYEIPTIFAPMAPVDADNLDEILIDSGLYTREQIYGN